MLCEGTEVNPLSLELDLATADPRDVQQIADEASEALRLALDHQMQLGRWAVGLRKTQKMDRMGNRREGCPELVGQHREELVLAAPIVAQDIGCDMLSRHVLDGEQDRLGALVIARNLSSAERENALPDGCNGPAHLVRIHGFVAPEHRQQAFAQQRVVPLTVAQVVDDVAFHLFAASLEIRVERMVRAPHPQLAVEHE